MKSTFALMLTGVLGVTVVGCSSNELETRRLATSAALSEYPGNAQKLEKATLAAVDNQDAKNLRILNLSDDPVAPGLIWVNARYVNQIGTIPARSTIVIPYSDLLEGGSGVMDLSKSDEQIQKVEIQTEGGLFSILGPSRM